MTGKRKKSRKKMWRVIYVLLLLGCLFCIAFGLLYWLREKREAAEEELRHQELLEQVTQPETEEEAAEEPLKEEKVQLPVDFEALWEINPEVYAWIRIPDTNVDYPILQREGEDQSYYLTHDLYGEVKSEGSIYTESYNSRDFRDPNTVIYGHNMKNGSMFHNLRYFAEQEFFDEHEDLYLYLPDRILRYRIFASYEFDDRHLLGSYDLSTEEGFAAYIEEIMNPRSMYAILREDCPVTTEDRIITLSTCIANKPNNRRLVQAVLVEETEAQYPGGTEEKDSAENHEESSEKNEK